MAGRIKIDAERCKGCGLCVAVCPKKIIVISKKLNKSGYFPAHPKNPPVEECTGCCFCALICPDAAIEVFHENNVVVTKPGKKDKTSLIKEKV